MTTIRHERPSRETLLSALGEPLLLQTNDEQLLAAAVDTFGRFPLLPQDREPLVVQIFVREPQILLAGVVMSPSMYEWVAR